MLDIKEIDAEQYKKTLVILKFILHGILGIISTESEGDIEIDYIKKLMTNKNNNISAIVYYVLEDKYFLIDYYLGDPYKESGKFEGY